MAMAVAVACTMGLPAVLRADGAASSPPASSQPAASQPASALPAGWQQLSQADFVALCESWTGAVAGSTRADRTKLASFAWTAWLNDPQKAGALTPDQFITLSSLAVSGLSNADCDLLKNVLLRQLPTNAAVQPLGLVSLDRLTGSVASRLAFTPDQVNGWLQSWVDGHNGGTDLSLQDAARAWDLCRLHMPAASPVFQNLAQNMWNKYLQPKEGWDPLADADVMLYYNRLYGFLPKAQQSPLCQNVWRRLNADVPQISAVLTARDLHRMDKEIIPAASVPLSNIVPLVAGFLTSQGATCTLHDLGYGIFLISAFLHDPNYGVTVGTAYQSVAANTIAKLSANASVEAFDDAPAPQLGNVFQSDADRQQLRNLFTTAVLENRLAAAQILSWSSMYAGGRVAWWKEVSAKIADPQADADTKAFWILVSGEIEETRYLETHPDADLDLRLKRASLDKALAAAQGEPMRILVLEEITAWYLSVHDGADGASLLASVSAQFSPAAQPQIKQMVQMLTAQQNYLNSQAQIASVKATNAIQAAQLKNYQASLTRAQMDHNQNASTKIQTAMTALQAQMQSSATQPGGQQSGGQ